MVHVADSHISRDMQTCIDSCSDCHGVCLELIDHCLRFGGEHSRPHHIKQLQDCAEVCQVVLNAMLRVSSHYPRLCEVCAEVCDACGRDCARAAREDPVLLQGAEVCRTCADHCRSLEQAA
jgi:hypothetical protein